VGVLGEASTRNGRRSFFDCHGCQLASFGVRRARVAAAGFAIVLPGELAAERKMRRALLLEVMPGIATGLPTKEAERARHGVVVEIFDLEPGPWTPDRTPPGPGHLGLLLVDGIILRELVVGGARSVELLAKGDVLRPWQEEAASFCDASWRCLTRVQLANLGPPAASAICRSPALVETLVDRTMRRSRSLAVHAAVESLVGLERRLVLLFWHLAENLGRRTSEGVEVPLNLTHETIAHLVGARRPSVSAALTALARSGRIERRNGTWILHGDPPGMDLK
jgi:CRP/FNR family cyclic AMP-dependent transcriptional regulator